MSAQPDPEEWKDRQRFQAIHDARETARQAIVEAEFVTHTSATNEVRYLKRAHSATVGFLLLLEPDLRARGALTWPGEGVLGYIEFGDGAEVLVVEDLQHYATLTNPVTRSIEGVVGTYNVQQTQREVHEFIPLEIVRNAFSNIHEFAHRNNLVKGMTVDKEHGDPF